MAQGTPQPAVQPVVLQAPQQMHHLPQQTPAYSVSANWARVQPNNSMQIYVAQPQQVNFFLIKAIWNRLTHITSLLLDASKNFHFQFELEVPMIKWINYGFIRNCRFQFRNKMMG